MDVSFDTAEIDRKVFAEEMSKWWSEKDFFLDFEEQIITCDMDADCIVSENDEKVFAMVFVSCIISLQ